MERWATLVLYLFVWQNKSPRSREPCCGGLAERVCRDQMARFYAGVARDWVARKGHHEGNGGRLDFAQCIEGVGVVPALFVPTLHPAWHFTLGFPEFSLGLETLEGFDFFLSHLTSTH